MITALAFLVALVAGPHGTTVAAAQAPVPPAPPAPTIPAAPAAVVPSTPLAAASAAPTVAPAATVTPTPVPTATPSPYKYRFVPHYAAHLSAGVPQIYAVYLNDKQLHSLGPIHIKVVTTPNVVKVISRSNGRDGVIPIVAPGDFEATSVLPKIPFIAAGMTLDLEFVATTAQGRTSIVRVPVRLN